MPANREWKDAGATLFEVVVALAILGGVTGAVAVARRPDPARAQVQAAVEILASDLRVVRSRALATGAPAGLRLHLDTQQYVLLPPGRLRQVSAPLSFSVSTNAEPEQHHGTVDVAFTPLGLSAGGSIQIKSGSVVRSVHIEPMSGRIVVAP